MANASFMQTSFLGGEWSSYSQGRIDSDRWKTALNVCLNAFPLEEGSWTRRQGTRFVATTKGGLAAGIFRFEYAVDQPFQIELGSLYARFFFGQSPIFTADQQNVVSISAATPAVVTTGTHGWVDNNQVMFFFEAGGDGDEHTSAPTLRTRQFNIDVLSATTFALYDAITGEAVDGSTLSYAAGTGVVKRIFEITTVYDGNAWENIRVVQNEDEVITLNPAYKPYILTVGTVATPFVLTASDFLDGPYMNINTTATTLDPSGVSGSVTLVASATTGVNDGQGFLPTDVGRLIRLFWEPAAWSSGSGYAVGSLVKYNDQYFVNIKATIAGAPTPERDITSWSFATDAVVWTWGQITAWTSTTQVTFLIRGDALPDSTARLKWRMGLYSDTTGWPTVGRFHDGRLWLSGVQPNRLDASKSNPDNGFFDFQPTLPDGTVADDNAISAVAHSDDRNNAVWILTDEQGLYVGTEGGEWRGRASVNNDPISPTNFDLRRVTKYKCHNSEPAQAPNMTLFIQLQRRKVMEWGYFEGAGFKAAHLSVAGRHLTTSGLEQVVYQNEPIPMVWARRTDGVLIGAAYKRDAEEGYYAAWHKVDLGEERVTTWLSIGASLSGLSEAMWQVSRGDDGVHFIEIMTPVFEDDTEGFAAYFVDSGITPQFGVITGGNVVFYGFWPLVGTDVAVMVNGIDTGDYTVAANGSITVPIGGTDSGYTLADLEALSDSGADFGEFSVTLDAGAGSAPPDETGHIIAHVPTFGDLDEVVDYIASDIAFDANRDRMYFINTGSAASDGIMAFSFRDGGTKILENNLEGIYGAGAGKPLNIPMVMDAAGYLYVISSSGNTRTLDKIDPNNLTSIATYGEMGSSLTIRGTGLVGPANADAVRTTDGYDFLVCTSLGGDIQFVNLNTMTFPGQGFANSTLDNDECYVVEGAPNTGVAWVTNFDNEPTASALSLYKVEIGAGAADWVAPVPITNWTLVPNTAITNTKIGTITPAEVNAAWTRFLASRAPILDRTDGNLLMFVQGDNGAGGTLKYYLVKIDVTTANLLWATEVTNIPVATQHRSYVDDNTYAFLAGVSGTHSLYVFNTSTGVATPQSWSGLSIGASAFDSISGSIFVHGSYADGSYALPSAEIGDYFDATVADGLSNTWMRIFPLAPQASGVSSLRVYNRIPAVIGYTYTSRGQLLRPDFGNDAGAANGPAFGKVRRIHKYAAYVLRARGVEFGIDFDTSLRPAPLLNPDGTDLAPGVLFTGAFEDTMDADYDMEGKIAWEITRPYPATVTVVAGYLAAQDK